jgi:lysophospholipase L1-like esterase
LEVETSPSAPEGKPRRHYSFKVKCLSVLISIAVTLLVLESGTRLVFALRGIDIRVYQPSFINSRDIEIAAAGNRYDPHPFLPYSPKPFDSRKVYTYPDSTQQLMVVEYAHNSLGFRTPERPFEKNPNVKRIVALGGSTTWEGPRNDLTWPALLEKKLNEHYEKSGMRVEVINLGVGMASSPTSLIDLAFVGVEYHPDLVISCDGVNDSFLMGLEGTAPDYRSTMGRLDEGMRTLQARLPRLAFKSYLVSILSHKYDSMSNVKADLYSQVVANHTSKLKPAANPLEGIKYLERNLRLMRAMSKEHQAGFVASTSHWIEPTPKINLLNSELRQFFQRYQLDYLDMDQLLPHGDPSLHRDPVHWTEKGLDQVAELWKTKIVSSDLLGLNKPR